MNGYFITSSRIFTTTAFKISIDYAPTIAATPVLGCRAFFDRSKGNLVAFAISGATSALQAISIFKASAAGGLSSSIYNPLLVAGKFVGLVIGANYIPDERSIYVAIPLILVLGFSIWSIKDRIGAAFFLSL